MRLLTTSMRSRILALLAACATTACSTGEPVGFDEARTITVELDAFSGLPNPTWTLHGNEAAEVNGRLNQLRSVATVPLTEKLGYRGFILTSPAEPDLSLRVVDGVIVRKRSGEPEQYFGDARGLEPLLKAQAAARGHSAAMR